MAARKSKGKNRVFTGEIPVEIGNMQFWRSLAAAVLEDVDDDKWKVSEVSCVLQQIVFELSSEWKRISRICDKNEDKTVPFTYSIEIDRRNELAEIKVRIAYSEKYSVSSKVKVPDPDQTELPLEATGTEAGDGQGNEAAQS